MSTKAVTNAVTKCADPEKGYDTCPPELEAEDSQAVTTQASEQTSDYKEQKPKPQASETSQVTRSTWAPTPDSEALRTTNDGEDFIFQAVTISEILENGQIKVIVKKGIQMGQTLLVSANELSRLD